MGTSELLLSDCKNGDLLYTDIYSQSGILLAAKETFLNEFIIQRLQYLGVDKVKIYRKDSASSYDCQREAFSSRYIDALENLTKAVKALAAGEGFEYKHIETARETVVGAYRSNAAVAQCLTGIRSFDDYTYTHCLNTAFYALLLSRWLGLTRTECKLAVEAGLLHDIGKLKIPPAILNKPGRLTPEEYEVIQKHPAYGFEMVVDIREIKKEVKYAILMHHERMDKSGYPLKTEPKDIGLLAKIISVADVYDAMVSDRIYKKRTTPFEAFDMFRSIGYSIFDVDLINCFLKNIANCYVGARVLLKNGEHAKIVYIPPQNITDPVLEINDTYVSMQESPDYTIEEML